MELKSKERIINGTWTDVFCAFNYVVFHLGENYFPP